MGDDWQTIRGRLKRIQHAIRADLPENRWCWHVEPNPAGTGHHVHLWQRGGYIPQRRLSAVAKREGCGGVVDIREWRQDPTDKLKYGIKLTGVFYGIKTADEQQGMSDYLDANGGRLVHTTRGFWLDAAGAPCTQRAAMDAAVKSSKTDDPGPWELVPETVTGVLSVVLSGGTDEERAPRGSQDNRGAPHPNGAQRSPSGRALPDTRYRRA